MQHSGRHPNLFCNCTGAPPWPGMMRLDVDGDKRYDVCRECGVICEQAHQPDGALAKACWYALDQRAALPAAVIEQAQRALAQVAPEMMFVSAGEFLMGSSAADIDAMLSDSHDSLQKWYAGEQPQHTVYLADYYIAKTPVTNAQYRAFIKATDHQPPWHWEDGLPPFARDEHPAARVSWYDALAYCQWLTRLTGQAHCLPSEAQWEKAARGANGSLYPWGNEFDAAKCNCVEAGECATTPVEAYAQGASPYGVLDMAGNVWEWVRRVTALCNRSYKDLRGNERDTRKPIWFSRRGNPTVNIAYQRSGVRRS